MSVTAERLNILTQALINEVRKYVINSEEHVRLMFSAVLAGEHVLIEGPPGTAKTLLANVFAKALGMEFKRIQMTVETMPSDITGFYLYTLSGQRSLVKGPIFANIVLVDELNRAPPRTQSALLAAMQEKQVVIETEIHQLPKPFMLIATQMPAGAGTYPLPEVVLDRFAVRLDSSYLPPEKEVEVLERVDFIEALNVTPITSRREILVFSESIKELVFVDDDIMRYIVNLVNYIRHSEKVEVPPSTRAAVHLYKISRAYAATKGRDYVIPDDVKVLAQHVLSHRFRVRPELEGATEKDVVKEALENVEVPK